MEMTMNMGAFEELNHTEIMEADGGSGVGQAIGVTTAAVLMAWAAPAGLIFASGWAFGAMGLTGAALLGKSTGLY